MDEAVRAAGTAARKSLFHFTRLVNVPVIAGLDRLMSSSRLHPEREGQRRARATEITCEGQRIMLNAHLRIPDSMLDPSVSQESFRAVLDAHVFFWPTRRDCRLMLTTYEKREPETRFAVLEFDAYSLMSQQPYAVKLSKYDSGSAPRFPHRCSYRKSPSMFLPLLQFGHTCSSLVPVRVSDIREVLVHGEVPHIKEQLLAVYLDLEEDTPEVWHGLWRPLTELRGEQRAGDALAAKDRSFS